MSQPHFGLSVKVNPTFPKVGSWSPTRLSKIQSSIAGVKSLCIWVFLVSLERSWSVDVQNGLTLVIWTFAAQVMDKRKARSQTDSRPLKVRNRPVPDVRSGSATWRWKALVEGYKFGLDLVPIGGRARSYEVLKSQESKPGQFWDSTSGIPGKRAIRMPLLWANAKYTIGSMVVASPEPGLWCVMWVRVSPWLGPTPNACRMSYNQLVLVLDAGSWPNSLISS
jgi:hypothetical protein